MARAVMGHPVTNYNEGVHNKSPTPQPRRRQLPPRQKLASDYKSINQRDLDAMTSAAVLIVRVRAQLRHKQIIRVLATPRGDTRASDN